MEVVILDALQRTYLRAFGTRDGSLNGREEFVALDDWAFLACMNTRS